MLQKLCWDTKRSQLFFQPKFRGLCHKQPVFSFNKFPNVNKQLGPEMKSTGESILFIDSLKEDEFYDLYAEENVSAK